MLTNLNTFVPIVSLLLTLVLAVGGIFAFRGAMSRSTIEMLQAQNETQERQIKALEKEVARLNGAFTAIQETLKDYGLSIEIGSTMVTVTDTGAKQTHIVKKIRITDEHTRIEKKDEHDDEK